MFCIFKSLISTDMTYIIIRVDVPLRSSTSHLYASFSITYPRKLTRGELLLMILRNIETETHIIIQLFLLEVMFL